MMEQERRDCIAEYLEAADSPEQVDGQIGDCLLDGGTEKPLGQDAERKQMEWI